MYTKLIIAAVAYLLTFALWLLVLLMSSMIWPIWMSPLYALSLLAYPIAAIYMLITAFIRLRKGIMVRTRYYFMPLLFALAALLLSIFHIAKRTGWSGLLYILYFYPYLPQEMLIADAA